MRAASDTPRRPVRIAVDIGGTFTDLQIFDGRSGEVWAHKVPTTPADPSVGFLRGISEAAERFGFALGDVSMVLHGTTIATNAVLERKLPVGALITTRGFEDVLEIGRHVRREIYSLRAEERRVLVPRRRRFGVRERVRPDGTVETPLDGADAGGIAAAIRDLDEAGQRVAAVAVCLLHAYADPAHERALRDILREVFPDAAVSLSSEVSPEMREFERSSTTVLNALLVPVVAGYLDRLASRMAEANFDARLFLVQSNGGVTTPATAAMLPVRMLLSGPSGGAMAVMRLSGALAEPNLVGVDMGGTSLDVSVVREGRCAVVTESEVDGLPARVPMVEIRTIGAGGGSIAWLDPGGGLRVGPHSAGAVPGPVSYGAGGAEPTVTDANVVLGRIDPDYFLGGGMALDRPAAERALRDLVARPLDLGTEDAAEGVLTVANANMAAAIKLSLFEKGLDPRDFALVSFGGAGGLHAIDLAEELGIGRVVFPRDPGTLSAYGILFADITHDIGRSRLLPATPESLPVLAALASELMDEGRALLEQDGIPEAERRYALFADLRYRGQAFELLTPWPGGADAAGLATLVDAFHRQHHEQFAYSEADTPVEIVTLRVAATGHLPKPALRPFETIAEPGPKGRRKVYLGGEWREIPVYDRGALSAEAPVSGPAIIDEPYTTILLHAGWCAAPAPTGDLMARATGDTA